MNLPALNWDALWWVALEGLLPVFGANLLFVAWGASLRLSARPGARRAYRWTDGYDPIGWLYCACVISMQVGMKGSRMGSVNPYNTVPIASFILGAIAVILLLSAMTNRSAVTSGGSTAAWEPPLYFSLISVVLVVAVLAAGYLVHSQLPGGHA